MISYTVKYRLEGSWFWKTMRKVKGDGILDETARWFILEDERRVEIPRSAEFKFSKERFYSIKEQMEKESGLKINV